MKLSRVVCTGAVVGAALLSACADQASNPEESAAAQVVLRNVEADQTGFNRHLIVFRGQGSVPAGLEAAVAAAGGRVELVDATLGFASVSGIDATTAAALAKRAGVLAVEPEPEFLVEPAGADQPEFADDAITGPTDPQNAFFYPRQWHHRAIFANTAWAAGKLGSSNVKVAILDTGLDPYSRELQGRVDFSLSRDFVGEADTVQKYIGVGSPLRRATDPSGVLPGWLDLNFHGTHVGSTVASNSFAVAGVTTQTTLVAVKVCSARGSCPSSAVLAGMRYAAEIGANVANMSLGGGFNKRILGQAGLPGFNALINRTINFVTRSGTLLVVSAGNEARDLDHDQDFYKTYCSAPTVLCVSATGPTAQAGTNGPWTNIDALASYSNFGRSAIDVAAPGGNVSSVWQLCSSFTLIWQVQGGFSVGRGDAALPAAGRFCARTTVNSVSAVGTAGTSMASPHVTGLAALIAAEGVTRPSQLKARILQTADDLGEPGVDPAYGKGRINVASALGL